MSIILCYDGTTYFMEKNSLLCKISIQELLEYVAPCSLLCYTCPGYENGIIASCSKKLCNYFEGYYEFNDKNLSNEYRYWLP